MADLIPLVMGNWKMHGLNEDLTEVKHLVEHVNAAPPRCEVCVAPPFTLLTTMGKNEAIRLGAQDCHDQSKGAFTGDISAIMLAEAGVIYVIAGHSERRAGHGESDAQVKAKAHAAQAAGMVPIVCVGESLQVRQAGQAVETVTSQAAASVPDSGAFALAYEPIWAIGTGHTAAPDDIEQMHEALRAQLGSEVRLLYGGSVKASNAAEIAAVPNVNGALVGGASLKAADFWPIVEAFSAVAAQK